MARGVHVDMIPRRKKNDNRAKAKNKHPSAHLVILPVDVRSPIGCERNEGNRTTGFCHSSDNKACSNNISQTHVENRPAHASCFRLKCTQELERT